MEDDDDDDEEEDGSKTFSETEHGALVFVRVCDSRQTGSAVRRSCTCYT